MARLKRGSNVLEAARQRLAGLKSITPAPDFGSALSLEGYEQEINAYSAKLDQYNEALSTLDGLQNELDTAGVNLNDKSKRMLAAVAAIYGTNSVQYEKAGGTPTDERKRPTKKKPPTS